jgi:adenine-specific DNA-methyltransferase
LKAAQGIDSFGIQNRRYIGSKSKLVGWIFDIIKAECSGESFADIFAGTGIIAQNANKFGFSKIIVNDFLYSNHIIHSGFFSDSIFNANTLNKYLTEFNSLKSSEISQNYFSKNFGDKYFSKESALLIGEIRKRIESYRSDLTNHEYNILLSSLLYSVDRIANTVGHYDSFFKKQTVRDKFAFKLISPSPIKNVQLYRENANRLVHKISADVIYIDPPYNSRQYSRFYHILETLATGDEPELFGTALKPKAKNMSEYSRAGAPKAFANLISNVHAKYIVVSYNNTYKSKSKSSENKIKLNQIISALESRGSLMMFDTSYKHFDAGKTQFDDHRELLFVVEVENEA